MQVSISMFAAAVLMAISVGAQADSSDELSTIARGRSVVHYGDLDIHAEHDAKILLQRIDRAATKACGGHATFGSISHLPDHAFEKCRLEAIGRTVTELGVPIVKRLYSEATPRKS
jgi:UrcA family protein